MAANGVGSLGTLARSFQKDFILQAALRDGHAGLLGICVEVSLALGNVSLSLFLLLLGEILLQHHLCLAAGECRFLALNHIGDALREVLDAEVLNVHALYLLADTKAKCIANFVHYHYLLFNDLLFTIL